MEENLLTNGGEKNQRDKGEGEKNPGYSPPLEAPTPKKDPIVQ